MGPGVGTKRDGIDEGYDVVEASERPGV